MCANPNVDNPKQHLANVAIPMQSSAGLFDGEIVFWAKHMFKTLDPATICTTRHMTPLPPGICMNFKAQDKESINLAEQLMSWFDVHTVACSAAKNGSSIEDVQKAVAASIGKVDSTVYSACGKSQKNGQKRHRSIGVDLYVYMHRYPIDGGAERGAPQPCKLKSM
jgi:hypothetical protein